jgi:hypothetical protein
MKTMIEIPDELFQQIRVRAALAGIKPKELIERYVEDGLRESESAPQSLSERPGRSKLPLIPEAMTGKLIPALSNSQLVDLEMEEDLERFHRSTGR